jgi:hypothetical protein
MQFGLVCKNVFGTDCLGGNVARTHIKEVNDHNHSAIHVLCTLI